jgi:quercetin dioxygenase-like cupin family protein
MEPPMITERLREPPAQRFDAPSLTFSVKRTLEELRAEGGSEIHGHRQKTLYKHAGRTIAIFAMAPGGELAEHSADGTVSIEPVEGELTVSVDGKEQTLGPGDLVVMQPRTQHAVRSSGQSAFLLQVSLGA